MMHTRFNRMTRTAVGIAALALAACAPDRVVTMGPVFDVAGEETGLSDLRAGQQNAVVHWNGTALSLVASTGASTPFAIRGYGILSVAQHNAAVAVEQEKHRGRPASTHAAIVAASVTAMSYLFPSHAPSFEAELEELAKMSRHGGDDIARGIELGKAMGSAVVEDAKMDRFFAPWTGTVPTGPGIWFSSTTPPTPPAGAGFGQAKTWLLGNTARFRPAPPPAFGSPAFNAALAEVRAFSDDRTPRQDSLAKFWHLPPGTYAPPGYWNEEATKLVQKYNMNERRAAHLLAVVNMVMYDGVVASHEAKYHYWLLRPSQADAGITTSVVVPNFPAYPSNHATISMAAALVLARAFPAERNRLTQLAEEAALSRVYGGIHYRFDGEEGIALGRRVADLALRSSTRNAILVLR